MMKLLGLLIAVIISGIILTAIFGTLIILTVFSTYIQAHTFVGHCILAWNMFRSKANEGVVA